MTRTLTILALTCAALTAWSPLANAAPAGKVRIGIIVPSTDSAWYDQVCKSAGEAAKKYDVALVRQTADNTEEVQSALDNLGAMSAGGVILYAPPGADGPALAAAARKLNLKLLVVDEELVGGDGKVMADVHYVGLPAAEIGKAVGQALMDEMKKRGWKTEDTAAIGISADEAGVNRQRAEGAKEILVKTGLPEKQIFMLARSAPPSRGVAYTAANETVTGHPNVKNYLVFSSTDDGVLGAVRALDSKRYSPEHIIGVGIGGTTGLPELHRAEVTGFVGTVVLPSKLLGFGAVEAMVQWISQGKEPAVRTLTAGVLVTRLNLAQAASELGLDLTNGDIKEMKLKDWDPQPALVTKPPTLLDKAMYPVIDVHNHLGNAVSLRPGFGRALTAERVDQFLAEMDAAGVKTVVNLDGYFDNRLKETVKLLDEAHPGRFLTFARLNYQGIDDADWGDREAKRLEEGFKAGAKGLKIAKDLGLNVKFKNGQLVKPNDPKLDAVWEMCGKYHKPIMIHIGDPAAFFTPLDELNERWHELNEHPDWLFYGPKFPQRMDLLNELCDLTARHPNTTFMWAHFGNNVEDLKWVGEQLDKYPNMMVDVDARISELGRQPYTSRKFILKYQDRVMFGTDTPPDRASFRIYYRFLETDDEYFDCAASHHLQGFWRICGIYLPPEVLEKVYHKNAERVLGIENK